MTRYPFHPRNATLLLALSVVACSAGATTSTAPETPQPTPSSVSTTGAPSTSAPAPTDPVTGAPTESVAPSPGDLASVCHAAESQEGQLVYWNYFANPDPTFAAFAAAYPGIQVESLTIRSDDSVQRVLTEATAGRQITPDLIYGGLDILSALVTRGAIDGEIDWAALGVADDLIANGGLVRILRDGSGLVYNTDEATADELPDTWAEVIDPQWEGRIIVDPRGRPFDQLSLVWGAEETIDYITTLKETVQPIVVEGATAAIVTVASGQAVFTTSGRTAETLEQQSKGGPVEIKYLEAIPTLDNYHAVIATARHPLAAQCFAGWLVTDGAAGYLAAEFKANDTVPPGALPEAELISIDDGDEAAAVAEIGQQIGRIVTGTN